MTNLNVNFQFEDMLKLRPLMDQLILKIDKSLNNGYEEYGKKITEIMWDYEKRRYAGQDVPISREVFNQLSEFDEKLDHAKNIIAMIIIKLLNQSLPESKKLDQYSPIELHNLVTHEFVESYFDQFLEKSMFEKKYIIHGKNLSGRSLEKNKESFYKDVFMEMDLERQLTDKVDWKEITKRIFKRYRHMVEWNEERLYKSFMKFKKEFDLETLSDFENKYLCLRN